MTDSAETSTRRTLFLGAALVVLAFSFLVLRPAVEQATLGAACESARPIGLDGPVDLDRDGGTICLFGDESVPIDDLSVSNGWRIAMIGVRIGLLVVPMILALALVLASRRIDAPDPDEEDDEA